MYTKWKYHHRAWKWAKKCQFSSLLHCITHDLNLHPPTPMCTRISGSVVEILDNSKHYQPQCQSIFVSYTGFSVVVLGVDPAFCLSFFFCMHMSVCVWLTVCMSVNVTIRTFACVMACLCVCLNLQLSVCMYVHARAHNSYSGITGCWTVLSVDSVVTFGPTAPSNVGWNDEIWQMGTVLCRALPDPIFSPIKAKLLQGHHKRLWERIHMLANDSKTFDLPIYQSYQTLLFSKCLLGLHMWCWNCSKVYI